MDKDLDIDEEYVEDKKSPSRKCIVTTKILAKEELVRFVLGPENTVYPDIDNKLPGRGVWSILSEEAIKKTIQGKIFSKVFRKKVNIPDNLDTQIENLLLHKLMNALSLAKKSGKVITGFEKVRIALKDDKVALLLSASDGSNDGKSKIASLMHDKNNIYEVLTSGEMSEALGKENAVHVAIIKSGITGTVEKAISRLNKYRSCKIKDFD